MSFPTLSHFWGADGALLGVDADLSSFGDEIELGLDQLGLETLGSSLKTSLFIRLSPVQWWALLDWRAHQPERFSSFLARLFSAQAMLITPASIELERQESDSQALLQAFRVSGVSVVLSSFALRQPSIALASSASGAELPFSELGRDVCANLGLRLAQNRKLAVVTGISDPLAAKDLSRLGLTHFSGPALFERERSGSASRADASSHRVLRALSLVFAQEDVSAIEEEIRQDPALAYKLLSLVNTAGLRSQRSASTLRQAVMLMGYAPLAQWLSLLLLRSNPKLFERSALRFALTKRAKLAELIALNGSHPELAEQAFVCGLFSGLDALFDAPLNSLLDACSLPESHRAALLSGSGPLGAILLATKSMESSHQQAAPLLHALGLDDDATSRAERHALVWAAHSSLAP